METKHYYDEEKRLEAIKDKKTNPYGTLKKLERYLTKFPKDRPGWIEYIHLLIRVGRFEDVEIALNNLETLIEKAQKSGKEKIENITKDRTDLHAIRFNLLAWQGKPKEALKYYHNYLNRDELTEQDILPIRRKTEEQLKQLSPEERESYEYSITLKSLLPIVIMCKKQLDQPLPFERVKFEYAIRQIILFDEGDFNYNNDKHRKPSPTIPYFTEEFPFDDILKEVRKIITENNSYSLMFHHYPMTTYTFKYPGCGIVKGQVADYFKAVVINGTNDIVELVPIVDGENLLSIDLGLLLPAKNSGPQCKKLTPPPNAAARFNKRFGLN